MKCVFLFRTGTAHRCEVLVDRCAKGRKQSSSWICEDAWESLCPHYQDVMDMVDKQAHTVKDEMPGLHPSHIGHFNRINVSRVPLPQTI